MISLSIFLVIFTAYGFVPPNRPPGRPSSRHLDMGDNPQETMDPTILGFRSFYGKYDDEEGWKKPDVGTTKSGRNVPRGGAANDATAIVSNSVSNWMKALQSTVSSLLSPFQALAQKLKRSIPTTEEDEMRSLLKSTVVQRVTVPNSTVLPSHVIETAAQKSVLGKPLHTDSMQELVLRLNNWYRQQGYMFHMVTGATLKPSSATAELTVQEPHFGKDPVGITVYKEMIPDPSTRELLSKREYRKRYETPAVNSTLVPTKGHVKPHRIAKAMRLEPGDHFHLDQNRWNNVASSGLFSSVLQTSPLLMPDGTLQFHIAATEAPSKQLEYGVGRSVYTGGWEGELDFKHGNLLGGGEMLGMNLRKATNDGSNSARIRFDEGRLSGGNGGYSLEAFSEFYQDNQSKGDIPLFRQRQGTSVRVQSRFMPQSALTVSMERNANKANGSTETVSSTEIDVGPYSGEILSHARGSLDGSIVVGTRAPFNGGMIPYASASATTRQLLGERVCLALKHTIFASTGNLPHHVGQKIGSATRIRGSPLRPLPCERALKGTVELRIPLSLPDWIKDKDDAKFVVFADYMASKLEPSGWNYCAGIGLRKSLQGIPLQCDLVYSSNGRLKPILGIGSDFVF